MQTARTIAVKTGNVETKVTESHVLQLSDRSYLSLPISGISSIEYQDDPVQGWLIAAIVAALGGLVLIAAGLQGQTGFLLLGLAAGMASWVSLRKWLETRHQRLVIRSASGRIEVAGESRRRGLLMDLVAEIEERQAGMTAVDETAG